ncbi:MAG: (deoxy)nucleoside triphosphate pyrophosphohydrolase [Clostridia bacterium]|nr:(deoxy)nucleoside triphosphate pyrophosphohydrolase [Clostridia bacterium]
MGPLKKVYISAAVIIEDNKLFATQRGYGEFKDYFEFPGGKIEQGETPEEALIREIKEELDTAINIKKFLMEVNYDYPKFSLNMKCYLCSIDKTHLKLLEHESAKWVTKEEISLLNWLPADEEVLKLILDKYLS